MSNLDMTHYYTGITAGNSSHQVVEMMALHQTIKSQVEETTALHKTIRAQIEVTNKLQRLLWGIAVVGLVFSFVQAVGTALPLFAASKSPGQATHGSSALQQSSERK